MIDLAVVGGIFREAFVTPEGVSWRYGGSGLTAAVSASCLGGTVALASYVGEEDAAAVRTLISAAGVDDTALVELPGVCGTFLYPPQLVDSQPWPQFRPADATPKNYPEIPRARVLLTFGIPAFDPIAEGWLEDIEPETILVWDRQGWLSRARDSKLARSLRPTMKLYLANAEEAREDLNLGETWQESGELPPRGFQGAIIKMGRRGVWVTSEETDEKGILIDAFPVLTEATVGSGDVFAGALSVSLAFGRSLREATIWGSAAAARALETGSNLLSADDLAPIQALCRRRST